MKNTQAEIERREEQGEREKETESEKKKKKNAIPPREGIGKFSASANILREDRSGERKTKRWWCGGGRWDGRE